VSEQLMGPGRTHKSVRGKGKGRTSGFPIPYTCMKKRDCQRESPPSHVISEIRESNPQKWGLDRNTSNQVLSSMCHVGGVSSNLDSRLRPYALHA